MAGEHMKLFWVCGSTPCWRVFIALEEKGLQGYTAKRVDFVKREHKSEEVTKLNPRGQVPTFVDNGIIINESHAICDYLERCYSDSGATLIPAERTAMSRVLQRMHEAHNNFQQSVIENIIYYCFKTKSDDRDVELLESKYEIARAELKRWDNYLKEVHDADRDYITGENFSMADIYLFPHVAFCVRFGLDISQYPDLAIYYKKLSERPSIEKTWPPDWRTTEGPYQFLVSL